MNFSFSLSHLTLLQSAPPAAVEIAAKCGYDFVGLRLLPSGPGGIAYPLMSDKHMMQNTLARLQDTGVRVFDIESVSLGETTDVSDYIPLFEAAAVLGARTVLASCYDVDAARLADNFDNLCEAAAGFGLLIHLEFIPWSTIKTPSAARRLVERSGRPNARVLLDALHLDRSGGTVEELAGLAGAMDYFHLCDALKYQGGGDEERIQTARFARLPPGDGEIDLMPIINAAPSDAVIGIEIPSVDLTHSLGASELARRALVSTKEAIARFATEPKTAMAGN